MKQAALVKEMVAEAQKPNVEFLVDVFEEAVQAEGFVEKYTRNRRPTQYS